MSWEKLPGELRIGIYSHIYRAHRFRRRWKDRYIAVRYASVCREWQFYFEALTFNAIFLDQARISEFYKITKRVPRRRDLVKQIHLRVRLPEYDCSVCQKEEGPNAKERNNLVFTWAIRDLFVILSRWPRRKRKPEYMEGGLTLDIGIHSQSDFRHGFRDFRLENDYPICFNYDAVPDSYAGLEVEHKRAIEILEKPYHDPHHGWVRGRPHRVSFGARLRITEQLVLRGYIPTVWVITAFSLRRQFHRGIEVSSLATILKALPDLCYFIHEPWLNVTTERQLVFETEYRQLLRHLPIQNKRLRSIVLFQDHSRLLNPRHMRPMNRAMWPSGDWLGRMLSRSLVETTRQADMEVVSAGFLIDAFEFFHEFRNNIPKQLNDSRVWNSLKRLYLTSDLLNPYCPSRTRQEVLVRAGRAAALMPNLERFVLWNCGKRFKYILLYFKWHSKFPWRPQLSLVSPREMHQDLSAEVLAVWQLVPKCAREPPGVKLCVLPFELPRREEWLEPRVYTMGLFSREGLQIAHDVTMHEIMAEGVLNTFLEESWLAGDRSIL